MTRKRKELWELALVVRPLAEHPEDVACTSLIRQETKEKAVKSYDAINKLYNTPPTIEQMRKLFSNSQLLELARERAIDLMNWHFLSDDQVRDIARQRGLFK